MDLIQFHRGSDVLVVKGTVMATAVSGAVLWEDGKAKSQTALAAETIVEDLRITLAGTTAQIETALGVLAAWLEEAARVANLPGMDYVYLEVRLLAGGVTWRSLVLGGTMETLGAGAEQRATKNQGVRLLLTRLNYWEDNTQRELLISSVLDAVAATGGVRITNHVDSGHANHVQLAAVNAGGDIPAPLRLALTTELAEMGLVYAGQNMSANTGAGTFCLEDEGTLVGTGVTPTRTAGATATNGYYASLAWSGASEMKLIYFSLDGAIGNLSGLAYLPLLRLYSSIAGGEKIWAKWRIVYGHGTSENVIYETQGAYLENADSLQQGTPINIPPWKVEAGEAPLSLYLVLVVQADAVGAHTLNVDNVFLLPLENWRIYREALAAVGACIVLDNPYAGTVKGYDGLRTHIAEGPGLVVYPGKLQRYYFLVEGVSAGGSPIALQSSVRMYYRPRKRAL
jgi:hypothetical protein